MGTTNLDDLLNQAEAQEASNDEWVLDSKYETKDFYVDEHGTVEIKNKTIGSMSSHISVKGESYSQYVEFKINRFYDGVDLTTMSLAIYYEIPNVGGDESRPINVYYNEMEIKFGWAVPSEITQNNLTISLCIYFRGKLPDGKEYVLKTKPANYLIDNGLEFGSGIIPPTNNWYLNFVLEMDSKVNIATNAASQSLDSLNTVKDSESNVLQYKQVVEDKAETVNEQYLEVQTMHMETKNYRDEAEQFRNEAEQFTPDGYSDIVEQVNKNTVAVNTIVEKADLGIKETASGEEIYLFDSAEGKAVEFALYGKAKQNTTTGKNLLPNTAKSKSFYGVTFTVNEDGSVTLNGNKEAKPTTLVIAERVDLEKGKTYVITHGLPSNTGYPMITSTTIKPDGTSQSDAFNTQPNSKTFTCTEDGVYLENVRIWLGSTEATYDNVTLYPMIRIAENDDTWEPYTNGASPNPDYPQEIEVSGESYNILENTATSREINGVTFTVNSDGSVTVNGTATANASFNLKPKFKKGTYIASGCPKGGKAETYAMLIQKSDGSGHTLFEIGEGMTFTVEEDDTEMWICPARIVSGTTANNLTFKPMIRKASVKNDRYMPYGKGSVEVKSLGKNLLKHSLASQTGSGLTITVDESIKVNGTLTGTLTRYLFENKNNHIVSGEKGLFIKGAKILTNIEYNAKLIMEDESVKFVGIGTKGFYVNPNCKIEQIYIQCKESAIGLSVSAEIEPQIVEGNADLPYEPYKESISTIPVTDFAGIPVASGGNYTDSNGQQWITNEIVKYTDGSGAFVQRVVLKNVLPSEWSGTGLNSGNYYHYSIVFKDIVKRARKAICNRYIHKSFWAGNNLNTYIASDGFIYIIDSNYPTHAEWVSFVTENPIEILFELAEPITTPLTAEEIAEISTFYPVTNISNDFDCGMKVMYKCDGKNYIDNKLAQIAAAVVNNI